MCRSHTDAMTRSILYVTNMSFSSQWTRPPTSSCTRRTNTPSPFWVKSSGSWRNACQNGRTTDGVPASNWLFVLFFRVEFQWNLAAPMRTLWPSHPHCLTTRRNEGCPWTDDWRTRTLTWPRPRCEFGFKNDGPNSRDLDRVSVSLRAKYENSDSVFSN